MGLRVFAGLLLCAFLLGATWPSLAALPAVPGAIVVGGAYAITQGSGAYSINASLAENLTAQSWTLLVSPEILGLGTLGGQPVVIRAASPDAFLTLERGAWVQPAAVGRVWAFAGEGLSHRLSLATGETVTLVGSYAPRIAFARISGIYRTPTPANDELLVDFAMGRFLTGIGPTSYHVIRIRTSDPAALLAFLERFEASVHVSGPNLPRADVHSDPPGDERLTNLLLRTGVGGTPRDYLATAVGEATTSITVVAIGIAALLGLLESFGIHAVQARAFADRAATVGVLRAVGAGNGWMRRRLLLETLPFAISAGALGASSGLFLGKILQPATSLVVFGHEVSVSFDVLTFAGIILAVVAVSSISAL
ncbi:MAG: ABC transporter permease, partial [Thermoplasmata archaeon]|nr:ABC transporter permease [Thermoplasmata archaeon]